MARRSTVKTLQGFDFSFQPPLDRGRILALARLAFLERNGVVHLLGPPGTGKSHPAIALGVAAVRAGRSVYLSPLATIVGWLARPPAPSGRGPRASASASCAGRRCRSWTLDSRRDRGLPAGHPQQGSVRVRGGNSLSVWGGHRPGRLGWSCGAAPERRTDDRGQTATR